MVLDLNDALGILIATLGGAAVGVEREWSGHAAGPSARFAGIRTFTLFGLLAGLAGWLWSAGIHTLAAVILAGVCLLIVAAYTAASRAEVDGATEVAAFVVLLAGVIAGMHELRLASATIAKFMRGSGYELRSDPKTGSRRGPSRKALERGPMEFILVIFLTFAAVFVAVELNLALRTYLKFRGKRVVSCPENHCDEAVRVAAGKAAYEAIFGNEQLRLSTCSRWPEKESCGQECLQQIEDDPEACLVWTIVKYWYLGQECAYCHKPFAELHWHEHPPALRDPDGKTFQWNEVPAEKLHEIFATHRPVCWNCHNAETFRRQHPEMVVDRPADSHRMTLYH